MELTTVLAAIQAGVSLIPEGEALIGQIKSLFSTTDQATIDAALAAANAAADQAYKDSQAL